MNCVILSFSVLKAVRHWPQVSAGALPVAAGSVPEGGRVPGRGPTGQQAGVQHAPVQRLPLEGRPVGPGEWFPATLFLSAPIFLLEGSEKSWGLVGRQN